MDESDIDQNVREHFQQIARKATELVQPFVVGVYASRAGPKEGVEQVGTSFLVRHDGRTVLVSAKHVLYGHNLDENPGDKLIIARAELTPLGDLGNGKICKADDHDLACMIVDELRDTPAVSSDRLVGSHYQARLVTIYGFWANGLRVNKLSRRLMPEPRCYTNLIKNHGEGYVGLRFPKSRFRNANSGLKVMAARPEGLSGGPMLDGDALAAGEVKVIGVFTDYKQALGYAFGETAHKVKVMMSWLMTQRKG